MTLTGGITIGGLRLDTSAYGITATASYPLTFGATDNLITFNNSITAATITGPVGGTGNVSLFNAADRLTQPTLTLNGTSTGGWSGSTTINSGMTLALAGSSQALKDTSGITLNGGFTTVSFAPVQTGGFTLANTSAAEAALNRVSDSAPIISNGGYITVTDTASGTTVYSETMGALDLRAGQLNINQVNNNTTPNQTLTFGSGSLTTVNGSARTAATASAINFSGASLGVSAKNSIIITGQATTPANEIIAPWATAATTAGAQTDYAVYNRAGSGGAVNALGIQVANIAATAQTGWGTTYAAANNYSLSLAAGTATQLTATRSINTLRNSAGTAINVTSIAANVLTVTGSSYANGDVVVTGTTFPTGLARETVYYVVNASGATFQLAATPGGAAIAGLTHVASSPLTGGIRLSSGNNLETYGILNGAATTLPIGGATGAGVLTTPTGGGNLYLTTGGNAGSIAINAPITDNGGAVTVVKNGGYGPLILSGNNTFTGGLVVNGGGPTFGLRLVGTQSFAGGITLNGGGIGDNGGNSVPAVAAAALNGNAITVNGPAHLMVQDNQSLATSSTITINAAGVLNIGTDGGTGLTVPGVVSGSGVLDMSANNINNQPRIVNLTHSANTFSGNVNYGNTGNTETLNVNSIGDGGKVTFGLSGTTATFALNTTATAGMTFSTRQFEIAGASAGGTIANKSSYAFTINTDLLATGTGNRTLTLQGAGAGLSTFGGILANGTLTSLAITKAEAGTWVLSGANTYSGVTTISGGTLSVGTLASAGLSSNLGAYPNAGAAGLVFNTGAGTLKYTGSTASIDRGFTVNGAFVMTVDVATANQTLTLGNCSISAAGTLQANSTGGGGTLALGSVALTAAGTLTANTANLTLTGVTATAQNLTLSGSATGTGAISGAIVTTTGALTKSGSGTWTINSGASSYTGATAVNAGTLLINAPGSLAAGSAVTVASGATLGGNGTINGTVSVSAGGYLAPGGVNTIGTLTLANNSASSLTLNGNPLLFDLPASGTTCDSIAISGASGALVLNGANYLMLTAPGGAETGTYTLMTYAAKTGLGTLTFPNGSTTMTVGSSTLTLTVGATSVTLQISGANLGALNMDVWSGAASFVWDGGALNWTKNGTVSQAYANGDAVTFDDTGANGAPTAITSGGTVSPASVLFNNSSKNYTVSANIGGAGSLCKSGSGTLTLSGTPSWTGGTTIGNGTVNFNNTTTSYGNLAFTGTSGINGVNSATVTFGTLTINTGVTATINGSTSRVFTFTGAASGDGTLRLANTSGSMTLNLNSTANTFTGPIVFASGNIAGLSFNSLVDAGSDTPIDFGRL